MRRFAVASTFFLAAAAAGCAGIPHYVNPSPSHVATVHVWIQRHQHLPPEYALRGCESWAAKGIRCVQVSEKEHADIEVVAIERPCLPGPDGKTTLAFASEGGEIAVITDCFVNDAGKLDAHMFQAVMGHEVGHELGIWEHVPEKCEKGQTICGRALMNPTYDPDVDFITPIDSLAFDARNLMYAVVTTDDKDVAVDEPVKPGGHSCEYYTRYKIRH